MRATITAYKDHLSDTILHNKAKDILRVRTVVSKAIRKSATLIIIRINHDPNIE